MSKPKKQKDCFDKVLVGWGFCPHTFPTQPICVNYSGQIRLTSLAENVRGGRADHGVRPTGTAFTRYNRKMIRITLLAALAASSLCAQDWAVARLEKSPRHREWVTVKHDGRAVETFVAYPESKDKTPVVLVIH